MVERDSQAVGGTAFRPPLSHGLGRSEPCSGQLFPPRGTRRSRRRWFHSLASPLMRTEWFALRSCVAWAASVFLGALPTAMSVKRTSHSVQSGRGLARRVGGEQPGMSSGDQELKPKDIHAVPRKLRGAAEQAVAQASRPRGWSRLHEAAHQGDVERVRLTASWRNVNEPDATGTKPLHEAANAEVAQELVKRRARPSARDNRGRTPLHRAVMDARPDVAEYLIRRTTARLNSRDDQGRTPLHWTAIKDDASTAEALLRGGARQRVKDKDGNTPMRLAMTCGSMGFLCAFLKAAM